MRAVGGKAFQLVARRPVIGTKLSDDGPEARAVVHFAQMGEFVGHHVIDNVRGEMDQPPVQADAGFLAATAPARSCGRQ